MPTVYLNIGSNKGHRHALIERAVALISDTFPDAALRRSSIIESAPWGYASDSTFLNIGVALDFDTEPRPTELLEILQRIERSISPEAHRNPDGSYRDRCLDIDIIAIDTLKVDTECLKLPHPRAALRDFVMIPLRELAPARVVDFVCSSYLSHAHYR